jgi:YD repeat-containing protein
MGNRKGYQYDHDHRLIAETNPLGSTFIFEYDRFGRCTRTAGDDGFMERKLRYFTAPKMTRVIDGEGATTEYHLNAAGQVVQLVNSIGAATTKKFDEYGRLVRVVHPDGSEENHTYDANGNRLTSSDPCGVQTATEHNENHEPSKVTDRNGNTWKLPSESAGSLFGVETLPRRRWNHVWDSRGLWLSR